MRSLWSLGSLTLAAVFVISGCKGDAKTGAKADEPPSAKPAAPPSPSATAVGGAVAAAAAALPTLREADVRAVVARWLAAQNAGNFADYEKVYATKMEGVKRVAERTWRYDRAGWLADRQRMFGKPMKVEVSGLSITGVGPTATVELEQRFSQGKFSDKGPKRLVVVKEGTELRIAREEMLRSDVDGPGRGGDATGAYLIGLIEGQRYVYLALDDVDSDWGTGPLEGPVGDEPMLAMRDAGKLPGGLASWRGREVKAYASDGTLCKARIDSLSLVGGGTPHFGVVQTWNGMGDDGRVYTQEERAEEVFGMSRPYLVGELEVEGSCSPVVVIEDAKAPLFYAPSEPDTAEEEVILKAYRALPEYKALQKEWKKDWNGKGQWANAPSMREYQGGGKRYVAVSTTIESCGEFSADLSVLFEERGGKLVQVNLNSLPELFPTALFERDGQLEGVTGGPHFGSYETYLTGQYGELGPGQEILFPFGDCGC